MKRTIILLASLVFCTAYADEEVNQSLDADPAGKVIISNTSGSIEVKGWDRNVVEVTGEIGAGVKELIFKRDGKEIVIKVKIPRFNVRDASADLVIHLPEKSAIEVATVSANIEVEGVLGSQELQAVSGDVTAEVFSGDIDIATVSGDISVSGDLKVIDAELASVSGDMQITKLSGELDAATVSGDLQVTGGSFSDVGVETTSGDMSFESGLMAGGKLSAESVSGRVSAVFSGKVDAEFNVETFNGRIKNCFGPKAERSSEYGPGMELKFTEGDGDGRVSIDTLNGNIYICKE